MVKRVVKIMLKRNKIEFHNIIKDILDNEEFQKLDGQLHHGITRYGHSLRVAKGTYKICKKLKMDYKLATRAALLHDFYLDDSFGDEKAKKIFAIHPNVALENAKKYFDINEMQANVIQAHMFPCNKVLPRYKESWIVTCVDKGVALYEMYRFKANLAINVLIVFLFNIITLNR